MRCLLVMLVIFALVQKGMSQAARVTSVDSIIDTATDDGEKLAISLREAKATFASDPIASLEFGQRAIQLAEKLRNDSLRSSAMHYQANALLHLGNYSQALHVYLNILRYGEEKKDSASLMVASGNIGNVYYHQHDFENALRNYRLALSYFPNRPLDSTQLLRKANLLSNIGGIYDQTQRFTEADSAYQQALHLARSINDHEAIGNVLNNLGTLHRDKGDKKLALQFYRDALALRARHSLRLGVARSCFSIGVFYYVEGLLDSAKHYLSRSIDIAQSIGALETVTSASEYAYQVNKKMGKDKEALAALEIFTTINDSLFNAQTTRRIAQLEMQFKFDKQQDEMKALQKERELNYLLAAISLLLLLAIAVALFLMQRIKTRKAQLKEAHLQLEKIQLKTDLEKKDKELATNVTFLLGKNELINNISEKLLEIKQSMPAETQTPLQRVILDIQSNMQPELWQEFEYRFQQVHESFYKILTQRFPDLTPSERRLCALLKLNMTTKEISALTHQNGKSIDVARTRLRKKLGLTNTDLNLVTFLEQLETETPTPSDRHQ
ncbi:MAG TPA: tetratricopeptide repeat protein [Chryseosolibacter sp.]